MWIRCLCVLLLVGSAQAEVFKVTPSQSLSAVVDKLKPGDTLEMGPGVYRQTLLLNGKRGAFAAPITIKGAGPATIIRGSDILSRWKALGDNLYSHPLKEETSMVFVNGSLLKQIGGTVFDGYPLNPKSDYASLHPNDGGVWPGRVADPDSPRDLASETFWFDRKEQTLYVRSKTDLRNATVEASQRTRTVEAEGVSHMVFQDFRVQHGNTAVRGRGGSMTVRGDNLVVERITADWNDSVGLGTNGTTVRVSDVNASYNGRQGMSAQGFYHRIERVTASYNNFRKFNKWWEAGGFKFIGDGKGGLRSSTVEDCKALYNQGDGIWFDWKNRDVTLRRSVAAYNTGFGIQFEASGPGLIEHNVALGNGQRGIYLSSSRQTQVLNNLSVGNGLQGIVSVLDERSDDEGVRFRADGNRFHRNVIAWNDKGTLFIPKDEGVVSDANVFIGEGSGMHFSVGYASALRPAAYSLPDWNQRTQQDRRSWWWPVPMSSAWKQYLQSQSTDSALLIELLRHARQQLPNEATAVGGAELQALKLRTPVKDAGPDWLK